MGGMHADAHAEGKAYHCSFHSSPAVGFQHAGPNTYFDIMPGPGMTSMPLGALTGVPLGTIGPSAPQAAAPQAVAEDAVAEDDVEPDSDALAPEADAPGRAPRHAIPLHPC